MVDTSCTAPADIRWNPTCHQGKGSRIDHVFAYKSSIDLLHNYQISRTLCFYKSCHDQYSSHCPKKTVQIRSTQRQVALLPELTPPESQHDVLPDTIPVTFSTFLRSGNTTDAFKVWSRHAETLLFQVANSQHHQTKPSNIHRGEVKFHDTRKFPRVIDGQATILKDRQLWKAMCRAIECQKAAPGYRRDKTWKKLFDIILHLPHQYQHKFKCLAAQPVSLELAKRVETLLQNIYKTQCKENSSQ